MLISMIIFVLCGLLFYVMAATVYQVALALVYLTVKEKKSSPSEKVNCFAIIVPAHNEELLIAGTLENYLRIDYPNKKRSFFIIADNCSDRTAELAAHYPVTVLTRKDTERIGKGFALEWALAQIHLDHFDAVLVLDADTTVDPAILSELDRLLLKGEQAIQCYIEVPNRNESWFTQLIYVSRTINDRLYHHAKHKLGLSSYLMGSGMCFSADLLKRKKWTAFTLSEDWEYYAQLIEDGGRIGFAAHAVVMQQESRSLKQATSQRLRWSSGRFYVVKSLGLRLLAKGIARKNIIMADASLALLFPNWSLQINLILIAAAISLLLPASAFKTAAAGISLGMLGAQGFILLVGVYLAGDYWRVFKAVLVAPLFLVWKFGIDFLSMTGLYRGKKWIRTERHVPDAKEQE
jgi:1,2-diacylglycerol 3-beta-glucosyltransferase